MERVTILCSDPSHPVNPWLERWIDEVGGKAEVKLVRDVAEVDFLFLIACHQIVRQDVRSRFAYTLVVHGSRLPKGRGWSPLIWQILEGANELPLALINAEDGVDTGDIWRIETIRLDGTELSDEIQARIAKATTDLMHWALVHCRSTQPTVQEGEPTYYPRRRPADSEVQPGQTIEEIFDRLRVADPERYPAFFEHRGQRYAIALRKIED